MSRTRQAKLCIAWRRRPSSKSENLVGDQMTTGEKASSMISQAKQTAEGDIDAMKRGDRNKA
jgi:hypothetical protein